ncbi:MAG: hypothetical protein RL226_756 [Bacteroidota bacterium]
MSTSHKILIVDDDRAVCSSLKLLLNRKGYQTHSIHRRNEIEDALLDFEPHLVLLDMNYSINTSGAEGLQAVKTILSLRKDTKIILMTGWATVQLAVEGMKLGAGDFLAKPWDNQHLLTSIATLLELSENRPAENHTVGSHIIGDSPALRKVVDHALRVAKTDASVLITGESGTGKELLAELIHQNSARASQPFVKVNLGGISSSLFESELFGHKKGSFTGATSDRQGRIQKAQKGSIFLDEIGELDLANQVKLLRVLQERTFEILGSSEVQRADIRVISATNRHLPERIASGDFREDLYYRINLIHLHIPPLRERREDIPKLVQAFCVSVCKAYDLPAPTITNNALKWLAEQEYSGNIRQLRNTIERTLLLNMGAPQLDVIHFQPHFDPPDPSNEHVDLPEVGKITLEDLEIRMIEKALSHHRNSISKTAESLGITRSALYRRLDKYNIRYETED